jgi:hypothetical protein
MKKVFTICSLFLSAILLTDCKTISNVIVLGKSTFNAKNFKNEIPFESRVGLIAIKIGLNGSKDDYDFVFDSGAGASVISKRVADSLKLEVKGQIKVGDALGNVSTNDVVLIKELDINGLKFYNWGAVVSEFGKFSPINCVGKDGIIGVNIMANCNWIVNYDKNTLIATDSALSFPTAASVIPFTSAVPHIEMKIGNEVIKNVMVDLGSTEGITIPNQELTKHPNLKISNSFCRKTDGSAQGLNGARVDTVLVYSCDSVYIGGRQYSNVNVTTAKNSILKVGSNFWGKHVFGLDYKNHKIYLSDNKNKVPDHDFTKGFGLAVGPKDDKYVVNMVFENSPASDAGIKIDDEVLEIDGKPVGLVFKDYCDGLLWQRNRMDKLERLSIKTKNMPSAIFLNNTSYRPVRSE